MAVFILFVRKKIVVLKEKCKILGKKLEEDIIRYKSAINRQVIVI